MVYTMPLEWSKRNVYILISRTHKYYLMEKIFANIIKLLISIFLIIFAKALCKGSDKVAFTVSMN